MTQTRTSRPIHRHPHALRVVVAFAVLTALVVGLLAVPTTAAPMVVAVAAAAPCDTDSDCAVRNPGVQGYGVADPFPMGDPMADDLVPWDISDGALEEFRVALIEAGFSGRDDGTDDLIYAPVFMVMDVPGGTWTTTPDGPKRCVDFATTGVECSDGVYLYWHPDYIGD